jgi:hypothetical protein
LLRRSIDHARDTEEEDLAPTDGSLSVPGADDDRVQVTLFP